MKKAMRVTFVRSYGEWNSDVDNIGRVCICCDGMNLRVRIPDGINVIDLVYTRRSTPNNFAITSTGKIRNYRRYIYDTFSDLNLKMYERGYRYVRVEY